MDTSMVQFQEIKKQKKPSYQRLDIQSLKHAEQTKIVNIPAVPILQEEPVKLFQSKTFVSENEVGPKHADYYHGNRVATCKNKIKKHGKDNRKKANRNK